MSNYDDYLNDWVAGNGIQTEEELEERIERMDRKIDEWREHNKITKNSNDNS